MSVLIKKNPNILLPFFIMSRLQLRSIRGVIEKRRLCTQMVQQDENPLKNTKKITKKRSEISTEKEEKLSKDVLNYLKLNNQEKLMNSLPSKLLKKKAKAPETYYLINDSTAKNIAKYVFLSESANKTIPSLEINPGCGLLTKELLKKQNGILHLIEQNDLFLRQLQLIVKENEQRMDLKQGDFIGLWRLVFQDKQDHGKRVQEFLSMMPKIDWNASEPNIKIMANVGNINFFKHLINSIVFQTSILMYGRCEMFLVVPPPIYITLTCSNEAGYLLYRTSSILFQIMFEYEFITKLPREHFLPWQHKYNLSKINKLSKVNAIDPEYLYLIRIIPRKDLYEIIKPDDMQAFWFFIKQHFVSRKNRVIPCLEKWIPHSGPRLIVNNQPLVPVIPLTNKITKKCEIPTLSKQCTTMSTEDYYKNINIFTQFGDLSPSQVLTLFYQFRNWPEYNESPFLASMESNFLKMESAIDENVDSLEMTEENDNVIDKDDKEKS